MTYSEFLEWVEFLQREEERVTKMDFYLAQIAREVFCSQLTVADRQKVRLDSFIIKFVSPENKARIQKSKQAWAQFLGVKLEHN